MSTEGLRRVEEGIILIIFESWGHKYEELSECFPKNDPLTGDLLKKTDQTHNRIIILKFYLHK